MIEDKDFVIATWVLGILLALLLSVGWLITQQFKTFIEHGKTEVRAQAASQLSSVHSRLSSIEQMMYQFAPLAQGQQISDIDLIFMTQTVSQTPHVKRLAILDQNGLIRAQTSPIQGSVSEEEWRIGLAKGVRNYRQQLLISPPLNDTTDGEKIISLTLPLFNRADRLSGAVYAEINIEGLWRLINREIETQTTQSVWIRKDGVILLENNTTSADTLSQNKVGALITTVDTEGALNDLYLKSDFWKSLSDEPAFIASIAQKAFAPSAILTFYDLKPQQKKHFYSLLLLIGISFLAVAAYILFILRVAKLKNTCDRSLFAAKQSIRYSNDFFEALQDCAVLISPGQNKIVHCNRAMKTLVGHDIPEHLVTLWDPDKYAKIYEGITKTDHLNDVTSFVMRIQDRDFQIKTIPLGQKINTDQFSELKRLKTQALLTKLGLKYFDERLVLVLLQDMSVRDAYERILSHMQHRLTRMEQGGQEFFKSMPSYLLPPTKRLLEQLDTIDPAAFDTPATAQLQNTRNTVYSLLQKIEDTGDLSGLLQPIHPQPTEIDLHDLTQTTVRTLDDQFRVKSLDYDVFLDSNLPRIIITDIHQWRRLLRNLLLHIIDISESGQVGLWLSASPYSTNQISIHLECTHALVPQSNDRPNVDLDQGEAFDAPFSYLASHGLPLTMVMHALQILDGKLLRFEQTGQTHSITFSVPAAPVVEAQPEPTYTDLAQHRVIILTQNAIRALKIENHLRKYGADVRKSDSVEHVLAILEQNIAGKDQNTKLAVISDAQNSAAFQNQAGNLAQIIHHEALPLGQTDLSAVVTNLQDQSTGLLSDDFKVNRSISRPELHVISDDHVHKQAQRAILTIDNPVNQKHLLAQLKTLHVSVELAQDGVDLLEKIRTNHYDLAIVDAQSARLNGVETCHAIRSLPAPLNQTPIFIVTHNASAELVNHARMAGATDILLRPLTVEQIQSAIASLNADTPQSVTFIDMSELARSEQQLGQAFTHELVENFLRDGEIRLKRMGSSIAYGDLTGVADQAAQLISSSDTVSAIFLKSICQDLVVHCEGENLMAASASLKILIDVMAQTAQTLRDRYPLSRLDQFKSS